MDDFTRIDIEETLLAINSMIGRTEKAKEKFAQGSSQHTLLKNRLKALGIAASLLSKGFVKSATSDCFTEEDLKNAFTPILSLINKSEKAREKLTKGTWQHTMLGNNLKALHIAASSITQALNSMGFYG